MLSALASLAVGLTVRTPPSEQAIPSLSHARGDTHSENMMMYWLMARSTPAAHPSTNSTSRMIIGGLRSG
jgi:hypothetical protein